jgi:hypothetical protein
MSNNDPKSNDDNAASGSRPLSPPTAAPDLFPKDTLNRLASDTLAPPTSDGGRSHTASDGLRVPGASGGHDLQIPGPLAFPQPSPLVSEQNRKSCLGPIYAAIATPPSEWSSSFNDQVNAEAAMSLLPAAMIGPAIKPAIDRVYRWLDRIPASVRRPIERDFGLLVDNALSLLDASTSPLVDQTVAHFYPDGTGLPASADLHLQSFPQFKYACAETAAATILKSDGVPVALGDVDTQLSGFDGNSGILDAEFKRRGLTLVSGVGNLTKLKAFVANGYPVMVSIGWQQGGGHAVVVSGYDDAQGQLIIDNWDGAGGSNRVAYRDFLPDWERRANIMTAVVPTRDPRLDALARAGDLRRPDSIAPGISLSDFFVTDDKKVFVEAAYRYVTGATDLTVRVSYNSDAATVAQQLNGSIALTQKLADGWTLGIKIIKLSLRRVDDDWQSVRGAPLAVSMSLGGPGFSIAVGEERGGFQGAFTADLGRFVAGLGLEVNVSVDAHGVWNLFANISGTF